MCKKVPKGEANKIGSASTCFSKRQNTFRSFISILFPIRGYLADLVYTHQEPAVFSSCF